MSAILRNYSDGPISLHVKDANPHAKGRNPFVFATVAELHGAVKRARL